MSEQNQLAEIGIFGGSGFYDLLENAEVVEIETPFGKPSDKIIIGVVGGRRIAFLPRHGKSHQYPPHKIPYKANLWAFKKLGVQRIISPVAVGSLRPDIKPGDFVICNQFVNWTHTHGLNQRDDTYYHGEKVDGIKHSEKVAHLSLAEPYCSELRKVVSDICEQEKILHHKNGTVVVIEGPRFSTKAESKFFASQGWDIINMTAYPEVALARELGMCYVNIGLVTDYDAGLEGNPSIKPVTTAEVIEVFNKNNEKIKELIFVIIKNLPVERSCECEKYLEQAII
ncbi:S-methyl-5'-thioadenosine phosphorylase [Candidatus Kuenenbacteria bacterium CG10_big_fil_rev_8_21_14_0_10_36_11]|uniref:Purine nucleoside phosphorylase n=1 Tax=Candidatus Kuenenbacteria bacterium CG10_big_fil_rev_8_21_14_0_10_36_11 TaxID=1974618 RepID=A0A2M6WAE3_9BACT|nr:MAG: S-methyl-5'-thioadenosine phosphorylase [Candidatus Kuenenbacteria bacterium CG10_big_fil_rev_8_21_14_0_10_36_11]